MGGCRLRPRRESWRVVRPLIRVRPLHPWLDPYRGYTAYTSLSAVSLLILTHPPTHLPAAHSSQAAPWLLPRTPPPRRPERPPAPLAGVSARVRLLAPRPPAMPRASPPPTRPDWMAPPWFPRQRTAALGLPPAPPTPPATCCPLPLTQRLSWRAAPAPRCAARAPAPPWARGVSERGQGTGGVPSLGG